MSKALRLSAILGTIFVLLVAMGWLLWLYQRGREGHVALDIAATFLQKRSLALKDFEGPVVEETPNTQRSFVWRSRGRDPVLELVVSPMGDLVCLLEVVDKKHFRQLDCQEP